MYRKAVPRRQDLAWRFHRGLRAGHANIGVLQGTWELQSSPPEITTSREHGEAAYRAPRSARAGRPGHVWRSTGRWGGTALAKETKRGGMGDGKSERLHSTCEAGEPTRGTRWREGGRRAHGTVEGKVSGYTEVQYGLHETSTDSGAGEEWAGAGVYDAGTSHRPGVHDRGVATRPQGRRGGLHVTTRGQTVDVDHRCVQGRLVEVE